MILASITSIGSKIIGVFDRYLRNKPEPLAVSLRVLSDRVLKSIADGAPISQECLGLGGLSYIRGYIVDCSQPRDLILYGYKCRNRPTLRLDDLVVNIRNINSAQMHPYCSLDPKKANILALQDLLRSNGAGDADDIHALYRKAAATIGPQETVIGGVSCNSRMAHVMINADYHMKKVSQGKVAIKNIKSCLDYDREDNAAKSNMSRFWFHIGDGSPSFHKGRDIVELCKCEMVVLTEKQKISASGNLADDKCGEDPAAEQFAKGLSDSLQDGFARRVALYADLENLFRLRALLLSIRHEDAFTSADLSFSSFLRGYRYHDEKPMPPSLPGLSNHKESVSWKSETTVVRSYRFVCGGVGMDMNLGTENYNEEHRQKLDLVRDEILGYRGSKQDLCWVGQPPIVLPHRESNN